MKTVMALLLALSLLLVGGCGQSDASQPSEPKPAAQPAEKPAEKSATPVVITPDPGPAALKEPSESIDASDGVDEAEAQVVGAYYLRALREERLGAEFGNATEEFAMLNQVKLQGEWFLTYSRTTVNGESADAYAATIVIDAKTGKQSKVTEAP